MNYQNPVAAVDQAFFYIIGVSAFFLFLITALMVFFVVHYRRSRHPVSADIRGNLWLEIIWTVVPTVIALSMFWVGWDSYISLRNVPANALEIELTGYMYGWEFTYPNGVKIKNELVVPQGTPIKFNITSTDVLHSVFMPSFRIKVDAVPKMKTYAWFRPDEIGRYDLLCTEYCGVGHSEMYAEVRVVPPAEYTAWLEERQKVADDDEDW